KGDTLSGIAARTGASVNALMQANGISNANRIYAGQTLRLP
ncbi:MAG: LysM domain-containing protein, partial [Anaerolineae bacterium]